MFNYFHFLANILTDLRKKNAKAIHRHLCYYKSKMLWWYVCCFNLSLVIQSVLHVITKMVKARPATLQNNDLLAFSISFYI